MIIIVVDHDHHHHHHLNNGIFSTRVNQSKVGKVFPCLVFKVVHRGIGDHLRESHDCDGGDGHNGCDSGSDGYNGGGHDGYNGGGHDGDGDDG